MYQYALFDRLLTKCDFSSGWQLFIINDDNLFSKIVENSPKQQALCHHKHFFVRQNSYTYETNYISLITLCFILLLLVALIWRVIFCLILFIQLLVIEVLSSCNPSHYAPIDMYHWYSTRTTHQLILGIFLCLNL